jgi:8-oxo-dGTP pyrophosphatase MutT (NUDIX family)
MTWRGGRQVIPRPPGAVPGSPAPWADLRPEQKQGFTLERVRSALVRHAAGLPAAVPDVFLEGADTGGGAVPSAVLVAMFEEAGETRVILTRRSSELRLHQSEVSFPGGRLDPGEGPADCALREAREEIGLDPFSVQLSGQLSPLATFSSRSYVTPVVGFLASRPTLVGNPAEVEHVFDVELADLLADDVFREERWKMTVNLRAELAEDGSFPVWFFEFPGDTVWGATARVLVELLKAVLFA